MTKDKDTAEKIIKQLFPIDLKNIGVWKKLEHYLVNRIHAKDDCFKLVVEIVKRDNGTFCKMINNHHFNYLLQQLQNNIEVLSQLLNKLLLSNKRKTIILAFCLLEKTHIGLDIQDKVSEDLLKSWLANFQAEWVHLGGRSTSKFLLFLDKKTKELKEVSKNFDLELAREMYFQAINYGGDCFQQWQKVKNKSKRLTLVVKEAKKYFANLKKAKKCSANSFYYPEFERFYILHQEKFQHDIFSGASKISLVGLFCKNFDLIYGDHFASVSKDGNFIVSVPQPLNKSDIGGDMEIPRLEMANPETCATKKLHIKETLDA